MMIDWERVAFSLLCFAAIWIVGIFLVLLTTLAFGAFGVGPLVDQWDNRTTVTVTQ